MVGLAQLAEHQIVVLGVVGSNPTTHPSFRYFVTSSGLRHFMEVYKYKYVKVTKTVRPKLKAKTDKK